MYFNHPRVLYNSRISTGRDQILIPEYIEANFCLSYLLFSYIYV